jgi:triacylglycerol lipase
MTTIHDCNDTQTAFVLSTLTGLGSILFGSVEEIERTLAKEIDLGLELFEKEIGRWRVVWGPGVYQAPGSSVADNTMYMAQNASDTSSGTQLVVAIAGTNPFSIYDWCEESFDPAPDKMEPWRFGNPPSGSQPKIAAGFFRGLRHLQQLQPSSDLPGVGMTLQDALQAETASQVNVTITGHSLGGTLAPSLALWLFNTQNRWDPAGRTTIFSVPFAGGTAGNADFAHYSDAQIGSNITRVHNELDIIPRFYTETGLKECPDLYKPFIEPDDLVKRLFDIAVANSKGGNYTQINRAAPALLGQINQDLIDRHAFPFWNFFLQALYQHTIAYAEALQIRKLIPIFERLRDAANLLGPHGHIAALEHQVKQLERRSDPVR